MYLVIVDKLNKTLVLLCFIRVRLSKVVNIEKVSACVCHNDTKHLYNKQIHIIKIWKFQIFFLYLQTKSITQCTLCFEQMIIY